MVSHPRPDRWVGLAAFHLYAVAAILPPVFVAGSGTMTRQYGQEVLARWPYIFVALLILIGIVPLGSLARRELGKLLPAFWRELGLLVVMLIVAAGAAFGTTTVIGQTVSGGLAAYVATAGVVGWIWSAVLRWTMEQSL